jgi:hypothetical protein
LVSLGPFFFCEGFAMITLDIAAFRLLFPAFADDTAFPDVKIEANFDMGTAFVSPDVCGGINDMPVKARTQALNLMTAHLLALGVIIAQDGNQGTPGITLSATIDRIAVTLAQPPYGTSEWRYWLNLTPYGAQLLALLSAQSAGGFYIGGLPERAAFRRVGGGFGGAW